MGPVVIEARKRVFRVPLSDGEFLDAQQLLLGLGVVARKGQPEKPAHIRLFAGQVVQSHVLAQRVPTEKAGVFVAIGTLPHRNLSDVRLGRRHGDPMVALDVGNPADAQSARSGIRLGQAADELLARRLDAIGIAPADEDDVMPVAKRIVQRANDVALGAGVSQIQQREVAVVELLDRRARRAVAQHDQVAANRNGTLRRRVRGDRGPHARALLDRRCDGRRVLGIDARSRRDDGHVRAAVDDQPRGDMEVLELGDLGNYEFFFTFGHGHRQPQAHPHSQE